MWIFKVINNQLIGTHNDTDYYISWFWSNIECMCAKRMLRHGFSASCMPWCPLTDTVAAQIVIFYINIRSGFLVVHIIYTYNESLQAHDVEPALLLSRKLRVCVCVADMKCIQLAGSCVHSCIGWFCTLFLPSACMITEHICIQIY